MINQTWITLNYPLFLGSIGVIALAIGSLLNVFIYRIPLMLEQDLQEECQHLHNKSIPSFPLNLFFPRSFCPNCKQHLKIWHNIPFFSYLCLKGRCAYCKSLISLEYPLVEILTCMLSLYAAWHFGINYTGLMAILFIWFLIPLFFIDLHCQLLPDSLTLSLLWIGLMANTYTLFVPLEQAVWSAAGAYLLLWSIIKIFYLITGKIGMGNGDFKLFAAFGAWFGWEQLPLILLFSSCLGAITGMTYLKITGKGRDTPIPFGPFLCIAGFIALFWGNKITTHYLNLLNSISI